MSEILFKNGDKYTGGLDENGAYNAEGKYLFFDGSCYESLFEGGKLSGRGIFKDQNGLKIETIFFDNEISGKKTKISYPNGANYEGEISDSKRNGRGCFNFPEPSLFLKYEGYFKNDLFHGNGKLTFKKGFVQKSIQGDFINGKPSGQIVEAGETYSYEGGYFNGKREGYGKLIFSNELSYEGNFKNGKKDGQGTVKQGEKVIYRGSFKDDVKEGFGELNINSSSQDNQLFLKSSSSSRNEIKNFSELNFKKNIDLPSNPIKYEGNFLNDLFHGKGKLNFEDGSYYQGDFYENRIEGYGKIVFPNNEIYEGLFKDNMKHGSGKYILGNLGLEYKGEFVQDCEVSSKSDFGPRI